MRSIKRQICNEEAISRLPSLFPYLEFDETGKLRLHKASDAIDGSYGKYVPDIRLPEGYNIDNIIKFNAGDIISYDRMMDVYYQYKADYSDNDFIKFVEKALGKIYQPFEYEKDEATITVDGEMLPEYIYLAQVRKLYVEMKELKQRCELSDGKQCDSNKWCGSCECCRFTDMGGDAMIEFLENKFAELMSIAEEYYKYAAESDEHKTAFRLKLNLTNTIRDIGYMTPYLNLWKPGDIIYTGERFTYVSDGDAKTYKYNGETSPTHGKYNDDTLKYEDSVPEGSCHLPFYPKKTGYNIPDGSCECCIDNCGADNQLPLCEDCDAEDVVNTPTHKIAGTADSKLQSLRRFQTYVNEYGIAETPPEGEDWLYFYREGMIVNYTVLEYDEKNQPKMVCISQIDSITAENGEITFTYTINAVKECNYRQDGTVELTPPTNQTDSQKGITYEETYTYDTNGDIDNLIKAGQFGEYITSGDKYFIYTNTETKKTIFNGLEKFAFNTSPNSTFIQKEINGDTATVNYLMTNFTYQWSDEDLLYSNIFKEDFLLNIHYKPTVKSDVRIDRGNNSAMERHLNLGCVKTLEDMENYRNGSFFNMQNVM